MLEMPKLMIRLILSPDLNPITYIYEKDAVTIGTTGDDLALPDEMLQEAHVKIVEEEGRFFIYNTANDPFVTVNGLAFGRKVLRTKDIIQIGNTILRFEGVLLADTEVKLNQILEGAMAANHAERYYSSKQGDIEWETEMQLIEEMNEQLAKDTESGDISPDDLEALLQQVEELEDIPEEKIGEQAPKGDEPAFSNFIQTKAIDITKKRSLKDSYLSHLDDDNQSAKKEETPRSFTINLNINWKAIGIILAILAAIALIAFAISYYSITDKNNEDELRAAEGVADIAMALTYAQTHHMHSDYKNWSDPQFISRSIDNVIPAVDSPASKLDIHGQLSRSSYMVRIHTSGNLSHFIVIAQPSPSLWHWIFPKVSVVLDSKSMELRRLTDIRTLNRLLLTPNALDTTINGEISTLISQGELIPLASLRTKEDPHGFMTPPHFSFRHPGAENYVYNAPRYYRFGESFLEKAMLLADSTAGSHEVEILQDQMEVLSKYPSLVLYSSKGMQWAIQANRYLNTFLPESKILVAYLKFNAKGDLRGGHLILDEGNHSDIAYGKPYNESDKLFVEGNQSDLAPNGADKNHPLYLQLSALHHKKIQLQKSYENEVGELLNTPHLNDAITVLQRIEETLKKHEKIYQDQPEKQEKTLAALAFLEKLQNLLSKYDKEYRSNEDDMIRGLSALYHEYNNIPLTEFMTYIQAAGLESFVDEHLKFQEKEFAHDDKAEAELALIFENINKATSLDQLNELVKKLDQVIDLERMPHPDKVIAFQTETNQKVSSKLNDFIFSNDKTLPPESFNLSNLEKLQEILKGAWISNPEVADYYLSEFELRIKGK